MQVRNKKWSLEKFLEVRKEVLSSWPTGQDPMLDLDQAVKTLKAVPDHKNFALKLLKAEKEKRTYVQPRAGVATIEGMVELLSHLEKAGADFLPATIDSYTRHNRYQEAEEGVEISKREGRSLLNGFPAVNHGVAGCKSLLEHLHVPLQARHGTPDARLLS